MRRLTLWLASTAVAVMLLFSYHTSTGGGTSPAAALAPANPGTAVTPSAAPSTSAPASPSDTPTGAATTGAPSTSAPASSSSGGTSGTFTGNAVDTRWGPVQVEITVQDGKITDVQAVVYPQGNPRDVEINDYALPQLHDEVITAQSAQIDAISGATVTSDGYIGSLQSALDAAHLGG